jgi:vacuolar-type H+-ATPase subunit H
MAETSSTHLELMRILEAEEEARRIVETAAAEARDLERDASGRAARRVEVARASREEWRERARSELVALGEEQAQHILAEAVVGREADAAQASRNREAAQQAVLAILRAEAG